MKANKSIETKKLNKPQTKRENKFMSLYNIETNDVEKCRPSNMSSNCRC